MKTAKIASRIPDKLSVWAEFNELSAKHNAINLSHGRPSVSPPPYLLDHLVEVAKTPNIHQYTSLWGHPELIAAVAKYYSPRFGRELKPKEILICPGAMAAHFNGIYGLAPQPEDEIVTFAPYFPQYFTQAAVSSRIFKQSKLRLNPQTLLWEIDFEGLSEILSDKTRVIMLNTPNNPTGKCFTLEEQKELSRIFKARCPNALVVNDCVYESVVFDGNKHVDFATIDDNWNKTITIYSAGKLLSCTGWKVGWIIGPEHLVKACAVINEPINFQTNTASQIAIARALPQLDDTPCFGFKNYKEYLISVFQKSRDHLFETLKNGKLPIQPLHAEAGYFLIANIGQCRDLIGKQYFQKHNYAPDLSGVLYNEFEDRDQPPLDYAFSRWLTLEYGVSTLPGSLFYKPGEEEEIYARFAICQSQDVMEQVRKRLGK